MFVRHLKGLSGAAAVMTMVACTSGTTPEMAMQGTPEDETMIRALPERWAAAFNADDAAGISAMVAPDYQAVAPDGTLVSGPSGVEQMLTADFQMQEKMGVNPMLSIETDFLNWLDAENATIGGTWTVTGVPAEQPDEGSWLAVVHKSADGQWQVASDLAAPNVPQPETPPASADQP